MITLSFKFSVINTLAAVVILLIAKANATDVLIPTSQLVQQDSTNYYVVSIGVNQYADAFWPSLKWPASDATRVSDQLGQATNNRIVKKLLIGEYATLAQVTATLNEVAQQAKPNDTVVLYISSHGTLAQAATGTFDRIVVLHDTQHDNLFATGLKHAMLQQWLENLKARKKMMVFATCHSGEGKSRLPPQVEQLVSSFKGQLVPLSDVSEGALVLAAAAKGEPARENDELQGDIYTYYLLEALTTYDRNHDGMVSALEAHDYARERTWAFTQGLQRPTAHAKFIGDADIPLYGQKMLKGLPVLEAYDESLAGFFVQIDNGVKGRLPTAFPVRAGGSLVRLYSPGGERIARYRIKMPAGESMTLHEVMHERPFSVGLDARVFSWSDEAWEKLSGQSTSRNLEINMAYHWRNWGLGLIAGLPQKANNAIQSPINADVELTTYLAFAQYRYTLRKLSFSAQLEFGREEMDIELRDVSTGDKLPFDDQSMTYGTSLQMNYSPIADFVISLQTGYRQANWDFGILGDLNGRRLWIGLGAEYRFGWSARTL